MMGRTILLVDDNPADLELCTLALESTGFDGSLRTAGSAAEALRILTEPEFGRRKLGDSYPATLVILDLKMPGMSGFELLECLPDNAPPVAVLSSSSAESDSNRARACKRVVAYLTKPPVISELRSVLDHIDQTGDAR